MKRTLKEKYDYNRARNDGEFSSGYCIGVTMYKDYVKGDDEYKKVIREFVDTSKELARDGDKFGKGVMCGYRDCANERKARQKRR